MGETNEDSVTADFKGPIIDNISTQVTIHVSPRVEWDGGSFIELRQLSDSSWDTSNNADDSQEPLEAGRAIVIPIMDVNEMECLHRLVGRALDYWRSIEPGRTL